LTDPFTYIRFFCHIFGHANLTHLLNNMMMILVLGPMLEEKYGSRDLIFVILATALVTGVIHYILFPGVMLMGASGVVFAFILLASFTNVKEREIPLTFLLVAVLYLGNQIYEGIAVQDNISQLTHIIGGMIGAIMGYVGNTGHRR
jgi:GlpG protein